MSWTAIIIVAVVLLIFSRAQNNTAEAIRDLTIRIDDLEDKMQDLEGPDYDENYAGDYDNEE